MTAERMEDNGGQSNHLATKDYPGTHEQLPSPSQLQGKKIHKPRKKTRRHIKLFRGVPKRRNRTNSAKICQDELGRVFNIHLLDSEQVKTGQRCSK